MRPLVILVAAFALLLALWPGPSAYAADMDTQAITVLHLDVDGCAPSNALHDRTKKNDAGNCGKMHCCLGAICVFTGLPVTAAAFAMPLPTAAPRLTPVAAFLTGREIAPLLDPPRAFG